MPAWKVLLIIASACACLALAMATILASLTPGGSRSWAWVGGLLAGTLAAGGLFALFLRHAGGSLDLKPRGARR
jgi:hypothetical protein